MEVPTKRILVTGASGFIGRPLVNALVDAGYMVRAATRRSAGFPSSVEVVTVPDFVNPIDWNPVVTGVDFVVHAGGLAHADEPDNAFGLFDRVNWITTRELSRAAARAGVRHFVYLSSVRAQTGPASSHSVSELDEPRPTDHYGRSKLAAESAIHAAGVPSTILRPVVVYGPRPKGNFKSVMHLASLRVPLPFAAFTNRRSFLGIDNLISAILFVLNNPASIGETFLVADPEPITIRQLFEILRTAQGRWPALVHVPPELFRIALSLLNLKRIWERIGDELVVDTSKIRALGWRPVAETSAGLAAASAGNYVRTTPENLRTDKDDAAVQHLSKRH